MDVCEATRTKINIHVHQTRRPEIPPLMGMSTDCITLKYGDRAVLEIHGSSSMYTNTGYLPLRIPKYVEKGAMQYFH